MSEITQERPAITLDELEALSMDMFASEEIEKETGAPWAIRDDSCADWAVRKIAEERAELARIKALADEQIARIMEKVTAAERRCENGTSYLQSKLAEFFETAQVKVSKKATTASYRLLSGTLKKKFGGQSMKKDDAKLVEYLKSTGNSDYIKVKEEPAWAEFKKRLEIKGGLVIDTETGEIVEGVTIEEKPDVFTVEV